MDLFPMNRYKLRNLYRRQACLICRRTNYSFLFRIFSCGNAVGIIKFVKETLAFL